jgi:hypothetical protein
MRTYSLIITKCPLYSMPLELKEHPKYSLGGKLLLSHYKFFKSSIYLKIEMLIVLGNEEVTPRVLGIDSISLIYI